MTEDTMALSELMQKAADGDFLRTHERSAERMTYRNGYRERMLDPRHRSTSRTTASTTA